MAEPKGSTVSIIISSEAIYAAAADAPKGRVTAWGEIQCPANTVDSSGFLDPNAIAGAIRQLIREIGIRPRSASVALLSPGYQFRALRLPDVPLAERRKLVRNELEEATALPYNGGVYDFFWLPGPAVDARRQADVAAYYASDMEIDAVRETLRLAGLNMARIEPASVSMARGFLAGVNPRIPIAMLIPSKTHSDLFIHDGQQIRHMRRIPAGWEDAARPESAALSMKDFSIDPGVTQEFELPVESSIKEGSGDIRSSDVPGSSGASTFLSGEITRTLAFFTREFSFAQRPEKLALIGPESKVGYLRGLLSRDVPIPLYEGDPLSGLGLPRGACTAPEGEPAHLLAAIGSALAYPDSFLSMVDLSRQETAAQVRRRAPGVLMVGMAGSTIWMILALAASVALTAMHGRASSTLAEIDGEIKRIQTEREPLLRFHDIEVAAKAAQTKSQVPAASVLGRLAASSTPGVAVSGLEIHSDGRISVDGKATDDRSMSEFARALGRGTAIKDPGVEVMQVDPKVGVTFKMSSQFRAAAPPPPRPPNT